IDQLGPGVKQLLDRPLDIAAPDTGQTWHTTARDLGMRLDPTELTGAAYEVGRRGSVLERLGDQLGALVLGHAITVDSTTDVAALDSAPGGMAKQVNRPATDPHLTLGDDGSLQSSSAQAGLAVDIPASRERVTAALSGTTHGVELVVNPVPPTISDEQLQAARDQLGHLLGPDAQPLSVTF